MQSVPPSQFSSCHLSSSYILRVWKNPHVGSDSPADSQCMRSFCKQGEAKDTVFEEHAPKITFAPCINVVAGFILYQIYIIICKLLRFDGLLLFLPLRLSNNLWKPPARYRTLMMQSYAAIPVKTHWISVDLEWSNRAVLLVYRSDMLVIKKSELPNIFFYK